MLSHHEIATLMLVQDAQHSKGLDPADLDTLLERQFVRLEARPSGQTHPRITQRGQFLLKAFGRGR
ncbi:hypothetical protein [Cupriavidus necator]